MSLRDMPIQSRMTPRNQITRAFLYGSLAAFALTVQGSAAEAQSSTGTGTGRAALQYQLRIQDSLAAAGVSGARVEADRIRNRLEEGDFSVGDRVVIVILNSTDYPVEHVEQFRDTLLVSEARTITVPQSGIMSLDGVLRPELDSMVTAALTRVFVTPPRIITRVTIPVTIAGQVGSQGFHQFPPSTRVADVIQQVGPTGNADVNKITVRRSGSEIIKANELRAEIARGATLDHLGIQAGDEIFVAERRPPWNWQTIIGAASAVLGLVWAIDRIRR